MSLLIENKYFKGFPNQPFEYSSIPFEYTKCTSSDNICTYGMVLDDCFYDCDYQSSIISDLTNYKDLKHIGEQDESLVFSFIDNDTNTSDRETKVLKCFYYDKHHIESEYMKLLFSGKDTSDVSTDKIEDHEKDILKKLFTKKDNFMCEVLDMFHLFIVDKKKEMVHIHFCFITKLYKPLGELDYTILSDTQKLQIVEDLIHGIYNLHKLGYYHGDLKTQNICVDENLRIKLIDFGTAFSIEDKEHYSRFKNTINYASPKAIYSFIHEYDVDCEKIENVFLKQNIKIMKENVTQIYIEENKPICYTKEKKNILEHGIPNDLFVIGLIIGELFSTNTEFKFFQYSKPWINEYYIENINSIGSVLIDFLNDPQKYIEKYYTRVKMPSFIKPLFEECIYNFNIDEDSASIKNTEKMLNVLANLDRTNINH